MKIKRENKVAIILLLIFCISIGYSFLSSSLNIAGNTSVKGNIFDVHFEDVAVSNKSVSTTEEGKATISEDKQTVKFNVNLDKPGDFYQFSVYAVNSGTIDAMIGSINKTEFNEDIAKVLEFSIKKENGYELDISDAIKSDSKVKLKVTLKYRTDVDSETIKNVDINNLEVAFNTNFIQADSTANFLTPFVCPTMLNIGYSYNNAKLTEFKSYYPNVSTVTFHDSINVPEGVPSFDISTEANGSVMAYYLKNPETSTEERTMYDLYIEGAGGISTPDNSNYMLCLKIEDKADPVYTKINNLNILDTSNTTKMGCMFYHCTNLTSLDLSSFDTSQVTNMVSMFNSCKNIRKLDLSNFDTSNVTNAIGMFNYCTALESIDLRIADFSKLTSSHSVLMFGNMQNNTEIIVKDEATKAWILELKSDARVIIASSL